MRRRFETGVYLDADVAQAVAIFQKLRRIKMTEEVLRETKIGSELNKRAWRAHKSQVLATESASLVGQWRKGFYAERAEAKGKKRDRPMPSPSRAKRRRTYSVGD